MKEILGDVNALDGVNGVFVCDNDGQVFAREMPSVFDDAMLSKIGGIAARSIAGLETTGKVRDIDLAFTDGRLLVKNLGKGSLCILCDSNVNVSFLNLTANVAAKRLKEQLDGVAQQAAAPAEPTETKKDKIRDIVQAALGKNSGKALDILSGAGESRAELTKASDEIEKMIRLFVSKKKAGEVARVIHNIIAE